MGEHTSPKLQRIFWMGHMLEEEVVRLLKDGGLPMLGLDPKTGKQWHFSDFGGHLAANLDGMAFIGLSGEASHTVEIKSMNRKMFDSFRTRGLSISHPAYVDQVQTGMGLSRVHACLMVAYCKDNSELWIEEVAFDQARFSAIHARAQSILQGASSRTEGWGCTQCFKRSACKFGAVPLDLRECRHCAHAQPSETGGKAWWCGKHDQAALNTCSSFVVWRPEQGTPA